MHLTEANSIAAVPNNSFTVSRNSFCSLGRKEGKSEWSADREGSKEGREKNKGAGGEMEQVGEENECGRRTNTYVTWACVLRSLSFEPDMVKDSAPVSSTPSESSSGRRKEREGGRQRERERRVSTSSCETGTSALFSCGKGKYGAARENVQGALSLNLPLIMKKKGAEEI